MKIAIMQPYFSPYLGYFQLINEVDTFVFYDDVNFIKGGWINRNFININKELKRFTIPLINSSSFRKINEIEVNWECKDMGKLIKTFHQNLQDKTIFNKILEIKPKTIADMAILSITLSCEYLGISTNFKRSSELDFERQNDKILNLVEICKLEKATQYINPEGGQNLYTKEQFSQYGIDLKFMKGTNTPSILEIINTPGLIDKLNNYVLI